MKIKLIAVLIAVAAVFIGAVLWRTDSFVYGDRMSWVESQARTQLGAINHSLLAELKSLQRVVATFGSESFQSGKLNWTALAPYYAAGSFSVSGANIEPQALWVKEHSKASQWTKEFVKSAIGSLQGKTSDMRFYVKPFQDSQRGRYVALLFIEGNRAYALFGSGEIFQSLIDAQRGALSSFSIVSSAGLTVGHSVPEYLGTVMRDDPVFQEAQKSGSSHGSNTYSLKGGALYGMFESVPQSNLFVLSSAPLKETMKGRTGLWWQFLLLGCGLALVGIAGVLWVVLPAEKEMESLEARLLEVQAKAKPLISTSPIATPPLEKTQVVNQELVQKEKLDASMRVASALAHEMRGPLASILGYSQMILAKNPESEVVQNTESILRETRSARGVLDKLLGFAGEQVHEKNAMKLEGPLVKALKNLDGLFAEKGVKIIKNIQETTTLDIHVEAIIRAITNILQNSVEAMERMVNKELRVDLFEDGDGVHLTIADTGEGIDSQNLEKIFDPFFTTRSFQNHMGLGLAVAFGVLKEHNAAVRVESQRGHGTKIIIVFKKIQAEALLRAPQISAKEEIVIAPELPQLKEESAHRPEAEAKFLENQTSGPVQPPLDVNIDTLLEELPESSPAPAFKSGEQDTTFAEGFLGEPAAGGVASPSVTPVELAAMSDEMESTNFILPPKVAAPQKTSKLDSYHVEIRRPGKRI